MREHEIDVLIVDDNEDFLVLWQLLLRGDPRFASVRTARSGEEARRLLADGGIDVVLVDVWMADVSGYDVAAFARRACPATAVVLTSCAEGVEQEALERGATAYVPKSHTIGADLGDLLCSLAAGSPAACSVA